MTNFINNAWTLIQGLYLCTVGYISGSYNPTLYKEWEKSKRVYDLETHKSIKFDCLLDEVYDRLHSGDPIPIFEPKTIKRFSFADRDISFYSNENLEKFMNSELSGSIKFRLYNMDLVFNKGLEKVIPIVKDPEISKVDIPGLICNESKHLGSPDPNQKVDTFSWVLQKVISERYSKLKEIKSEMLEFDESENFISLGKARVTQRDISVCKKLLKCLPDMSKPNLPIQDLGINDYSYYFMLKDYYMLFLHEGEIRLEQINKSLNTFLKIKPVFNSFEYEYINFLYGKPCSIPNMPQNAEQMGAFVQNMEFLSNMGVLGTYCRLPADCLDYILHLWF